MVDTGDFNARKDTAAARNASLVSFPPILVDHRQTALLSPLFSSEFLQIALCNFIGLSFEQIYRYARSREKGAGLSIVEFIDYTDSAKVSRSVLSVSVSKRKGIGLDHRFSTRFASPPRELIKRG